MQRPDHVLIPLRSVVHEHQIACASRQKPLLHEFNQSCCGLQALTMGPMTIETHHDVCRTPVEDSNSVLHLPVLPLLLEWHPETATTMAMPVINAKACNSCLQRIKLS